MAIQQTTTIPEVKDTIVMLRQLSADEAIRREAYYHEKRLHDEATALGYAMRKGRAEGMAEGIQKGMAEGIEKGIEKRDSELIEKWRKRGFSEEQIRDLLGE